MKTKNCATKTNQHSIWGSGLLAIDVVIRSGEADAFEITAGGTCANVLSNLAHLGWSASAKGRVGADAAGRILEEHLRDSGVNSSSLVLDERVETPLIIERFGIGDPMAPRHRFEWKCPKCATPVPRFRPTPIQILEFEEETDILPELFFFDRPTPGNLRLAKSLKERGTFVIFEPPRIKPEREYETAVRLADIIKVADSKQLPNFEGWLEDGSLVILTRGAEGLSYRSSNFNKVTTGWVELPALELSLALDACGSGDWLTTGLLHAFFAVDDFAGDVLRRLEGALKYGQALAALNCLLPGARGLSRIYERAEIGEMAALALAEGLSSLEGKVSGRASEAGRFREIEAVCNSCAREKLA